MAENSFDHFDHQFTSDQNLNNGKPWQSLEKTINNGDFANHILPDLDYSEFKSIINQTRSLIEWIYEIEDAEIRNELWPIARPFLCHLSIELLNRTETNSNFNEELLDIEKKIATWFDDINFTNESEHRETIRENDKSIIVSKILKEELSSWDENMLHVVRQFRSEQCPMYLSENAAHFLAVYLLKNTHAFILQIIKDWFKFIVTRDSKIDYEESELEEMLNNKEDLADKRLTDCHKMDTNGVETDEDIEVINNAFHCLSENTPSAFLVSHISTTEGVNACCATINTQNNLLAIGFEDATVKLWSQKIPALKLNLSNKISITPSIDHNFELEDKQSTNILRGHCDAITALKFCNKSNALYSASFDTCLRFWNLDQNSDPRSVIYKGHDWPIWCLDVSPLDEYVATGSQDTTIKLWSPERTQSPVRLFAGHTDTVSCIKFHPGNTYLVAGSVDKTIRMFDLESSDVVRAIANPHPVEAIEIHPSGYYLAAIGDANNVWVYDLRTAKLLHSIILEDLKPKYLSWSEETLSCVDKSGVVYLWDKVSEDLVFDRKSKFRLDSNCKPLFLKYSNGFNICLTANICR